MSILILGVGNILLSDEGLGVRAVEKLKEGYIFPENVKLLDGGTLGIDLLYFLEGAERLIIVDAVMGGGPPGTLYKFSGDEVKAYFRGKVSAHELGIQEVLGIAQLTGKYPKEVVVIGMEPESLEISLELSQTVRNSLEKLVKLIIEQLKDWQTEVKHVDERTRNTA
ncbi:HyaD/HybD family hydrogenase maturation endopeptidase [Thermocrinis sp.]|uniref:HyaD/HybD family hydrogenase maturation endopeptidase n=1 Tax=Thermocrinis sp. TaxID=2024383 RepID=UPI002FDCBD62